MVRSRRPTPDQQERRADEPRARAAPSPCAGSWPAWPRPPSALGAGRGRRAAAAARSRCREPEPEPEPPPETGGSSLSPPSSGAAAAVVLGGGSSPNGSWYWSSPAPCANASAPGGRGTRAARRVARRRHRPGKLSPVARRRCAATLACRPHAHPAAHRPRLDPPAGRRDRHEPLRPGRPLAGLGPPRHRHRGRLPGRRRRSSSSLPGLTVHRMGSRMTVFQRAALGDVPRRRPRRRRRPRGRQRHRVLLAAVVVAQGADRRAHPPRPPGPLRRRDGLEGPDRRVPRRARAAAAALHAASPVLTISQAARDELVELGLPARATSTSPTWASTTRRRRAGAEKADEPRAALPRPPEAVQAHRGRARRARGRSPTRTSTSPARATTARCSSRRSPSAACADRVTLHGHVSEEEKFDLFGRAWVNLTASSAEGWCLTVMESATVGTPSAALRVGGLNESIVDEQTGLLADTPEELAARVRDLVARPGPPRRARRGARRRGRAASRGTTPPSRTSRCSSAPPRRSARRCAPRMRRSETAKAAGMALATLAANAIAIVFTVVFTRLLGVGDYGALGALLSTFTILAVAGSALQVAVARETALGHLGDAGAVGATVRRWLGQLRRRGRRRSPRASVILREEIAALIAVPEHAVGRRGDHPHRDPVDAARRPARRAAGPAPLRARRAEHRARGVRAAACSASSSSLAGRGRDRRVPRHAAGDGRHRGRGSSCCCAAAPARRRRTCRPRTLRVAGQPAAGRRSSGSSSSPRCRTSTSSSPSAR